MPGFGNFAFGLSPYGLGTPATAALPPTGAAGCRYINPATGDYEIDPSTKQQAQMPSVRQRVLLAVATLLRSSTAVPGMGIQLPRKMGSSYEAEARNSVLLALRQLIQVERVVRVDAIYVKRGLGGRSLITISFTDLTTGISDKVTFNG